MHTNKQNELIFTRTIFALSMLCSIALAFIMALRNDRWVSLFLGLILIFLFSWFLMSFLHRKEKTLGWFISLAILNLLFVVPELSLRVGSFRYESGIQYWHATHFTRVVPDEKLLWKLNPSLPNVNSIGLPGKEIVVPKPSNVFRIVFLGDSCTQQGYPEIVEHFLNIDHSNSSHKFESVVLALSGYSSYQGRVLAEMYGSQSDPELVVVYFGWNDHWQAYGCRDSEKVVKVPRSTWTIFLRQRSRLVQCISFLRDSLSETKIRPIGKERVSPIEYRDNLLSIREMFRQDNIPIIFITAPTSHYRLGFPDDLVEEGFVRNKTSAITLHKKYNQIVKSLAQIDNTFVLDLEAVFNLMTTDELHVIFTRDGIHFSSIGRAVVAKGISDFIEEHILTIDNDS